MAQFPCGFCGKRYAGAQQTLYPALVHDSVSVRERRRACPDCWEKADEWIGQHLSEPLEDAEPPSQCCVCGSALEPRIAIFLTRYAAHSAREDFFGQVCGSCVTTAGQALFGSQEALEPLLGT